MKKLLSLVLCLCLVCGMGIMFTGCTPRSEKLIISNWGDYLDPATYKGFESWYKEKTGETVKVEFAGREFDSNEQLYKKLTVGKADYDLVCPSDYMVELMIRKDMLEPLDEETRQVVSAAVDPDVLRFADNYDDGLIYSMPYLWGTMGILYSTNSAKLEGKDMTSWSALWDSSLSKQVFMKDSPKDVYTIALLYAYGDQLREALATDEGVESQEYKDIMSKIFDRTGDTQIADAKRVLQEQKDLGVLKMYDIELGKMDILKDRTGKYGYLGMFWSCDAGFIMNGDVKAGSNKNVAYVVPEEGSNVWTDNFVIPKNAVNKQAANWFIRYLCEADVAYECMDYSGSSTAVLAASIAYRADIEAIPEGTGFFADTYPGFKQMYLDMLFPTQEVLARCGIMRDFGDTGNNNLTKMWEDVLIY